MQREGLLWALQNWKRRPKFLRIVNGRGIKYGENGLADLGRTSCLNVAVIRVFFFSLLSYLSKICETWVFFVSLRRL